MEIEPTCRKWRMRFELCVLYAVPNLIISFPSRSPDLSPALSRVRMILSLQVVEKSIEGQSENTSLQKEQDRSLCLDLASVSLNLLDHNAFSSESPRILRYHQQQNSRSFKGKEECLVYFCLIDFPSNFQSHLKTYLFLS